MTAGTEWSDFHYDGKTYKLGHLHPHTVFYVKPANDEKPELIYTVSVRYSQHCFTREAAAGELPDLGLRHQDGKEVRIFDFDRWERSLQLPETIAGLMGQKCLHGAERNFVNINPATHYGIFFVVTKSAQKGKLDMLIQSAYGKENLERVRHRGSIKFDFILHNTLQGVPIRSPK